LLTVVIQLEFCYGLSDLGCPQLFEDLGDLTGGEVALENPFLFAAGIDADPGCFVDFESIFGRT
jgi:hypothetical protein